MPYFTPQQYFEAAREHEIRRRMFNFRKTFKSIYDAAEHDEHAEIKRIEANSPLSVLERDSAPADSLPVTSLWHSLWHRGEVACLFGDTGVGKSLLANQIANDIASAGHKVLYVDFENPDMHFYNHYRDAKKEFFNHPNITYVGLNCCSDPSACVSIEKKLEGIVDQIILYHTSIVIIDDISHILPAKFSDRSVQMLQRLRHLALTWHMSILVLAHSRYHNPSKPLSITNLAGSREFAFSFDTVFALGKISNPEVIHDPQAAMPPTHYIRQFKTRATPIIYDQDNAMRLNLAKREGILGFKIVDTFGIEAQLIAPLSDTFQTNITADILSLHAQGFSIRKIAHSLAVTPTTVYRILKKNLPTKSPATNSPSTTLPTTQPHAHITNSVSGVSSVSSVSSSLLDQKNARFWSKSEQSPNIPPVPQPSISDQAEERIPALKRMPTPLATEIKKLIQTAGMCSIAYPFFQRDTPFHDILVNPDIINRNRFSFSNPDYFTNLVKERPTTHQLTFCPSASLKVYNYSDSGPLIRCGSLVYNSRLRQLGILSYTNGILRPFPHTFPESTTAAQLTEAIEALYTLTELKTKLQTPIKANEYTQSNEHESIKEKIATLEKTVTAILPPHLHPQILPQKCPQPQNPTASI